MDKKSFAAAFKHNFYQTQEWFDFCSRVTNKEKEVETFSRQKVFLLDKKNISISNYSDDFFNELKANDISGMRVISKENKREKKPSFMEYAIWYTASYDSACKNYSRSFKDALKQGKKFSHKLNIIKNYSKSQLEKVYVLYVDQMKRLNSTIFPFSFFKELMKSPSSLLFIITYNKNIIAYSFCFEYKHNLYASIGGGDKKYFKYKPVNKLYDELVQYASKNKFNIHLGLGTYGAGFSEFKEKIGAINYVCERFPSHDKLFKLLLPLTKYRLMGSLLAYLSKKNPEKVVFTSMPFT